MNKTQSTVNKSELSESEVKGKIARAVKILKREFGVPTWRKKNPVDELIVTILSQNTHDRNRDRAFGELRKAFPTWHDVLSDDVKKIENAIRPAGLAVQKSQRIKAILGWIKNKYGELTLEPLNSLSNEEAIELLTSQKGIGVKTAAVVLAFAFDRDLCPVDTHVHRISKRLGWVGEKYSAEATFYALKPLIPRNVAASFHLNILKFGRTRCTARNPQCEGCPLREDCLWIVNNY
ncbi:MAG: endonuclease III [Calditrichaeota bacterium]|nr:endonuclease III [Calditrichota bacterium]